MGFSVNTNVSALQAYNSLNNTQNKLQNSLQRLSSGYRINNAGDDAAGLSISEGLQSQISGTSVASRNAQDGISLLQTTDGALTQVQSILHRMRDLAVQGANDTNNADSREAIQNEADELSKELYRMSQNTTFNGINLLQGGNALNFQVGAGSDASNTISFGTVDLATSVGSLASADGTAAGTGFDVTDNGTANTTIAAIDAAITAVSKDQSRIGATENRFADAVQTLAITGQNLSAANSRIQDTDMASEMVEYSQKSVLQQAGVSMLAQANASSQGILKLLG
ncbi:flagellin [Gryllotalpicola kribbensis]|uniref:Flagellin n=1 Tax=Gryllotalpicola kribbensis TaxID=993084 RepID=A0ABP8AL33_9MICO